MISKEYVSSDFPMLFVAWHLTILPLLDLSRFVRVRTDPFTPSPCITDPSRNHWKEMSEGFASAEQVNVAVSPSFRVEGDFSKETEGANSTRSSTDVAWGTLSAELRASQVMLELWWIFFIPSFKMDRVFLRFPSGSVSMMVSIWSFIGEFQLSSQVIWKQIWITWWLETTRLLGYWRWWSWWRCSGSVDGNYQAQVQLSPANMLIWWKC